MAEEVAQVTGDTGTDAQDGGIDMSAAVDSISSDLFPSEAAHDEADTDPAEQPAQTQEAAKPDADKAPTDAPAVRQPPKSWAKEQHDHWAKMPKEAQDYVELREKQMAEGLEQFRGDAGLGRKLRDVITPYKALLQAQNVDEPQAVQYLLNAHYRLSNGQASEKQAYFAQLAKSYGIDLSNLPTVAQQAPDPIVQELQKKVNGLESTLTARQQAEMQQLQQKVATDVQKFSTDPAHPYFTEVADEVVAMINAGHDLATAYEKAVWANPVTRQKEIARLQTEQQAQLKAKAKEEAEAARKASSTNVRTRDTAKAPTGTKGKLFSPDHDAEMREIVRKQATH